MLITFGGKKIESRTFLVTCIALWNDMSFVTEWLITACFSVQMCKTKFCWETLTATKYVVCFQISGWSIWWTWRQQSLRNYGNTYKRNSSTSLSIKLWTAAPFCQHCSVSMCSSVTCRTNWWSTKVYCWKFILSVEDYRPRNRHLFKGHHSSILKSSIRYPSLLRKLRTWLASNSPLTSARRTVEQRQTHGHSHLWFLWPIQGHLHSRLCCCIATSELREGDNSCC
jgi:hypothetical protein